MAVDIGAEGEVEETTLSADVALVPFVPIVSSFSVFSCGFFSPFSADSTGCLNAAGPTEGALPLIIGSLLAPQAVGGVCLRVAGLLCVLAVCSVVLTSVSLLNRLASFSWGDFSCGPPLFLPLPLCFFIGLMSSSFASHTKCF